MSDVVSIWRVIDAGVPPQANKDQEIYLKARQSYFYTWNIYPFLQGCDQINIIIVVTDFSAQVRKGYYIQGVKTKITTIA